MDEFDKIARNYVLKKIFINTVLFLLYGFIAASCLGLIFPLNGWLLLLIPIGIFFFLKGSLRAQEIIEYINQLKALKR
jgi:hypothetical protein